MNTLQLKPETYIGSVIDYTPPRLHDGNDWYVDFYCYCPAQNKKRRKKIKLNFIDKIGDRRRYASNLIKKLHQKLEDGWNPWIEAENEKAYHTFADVCQRYRTYIAKLLKDDILREDTHRDYTSKLKNIEEWNTKRKTPIVYVYQFNREFITDFLEEVYVVRENSAVTRNNYLTFVRIFCTYLLEKGYQQTNPSEGIAFLSKRRLTKVRTIIQEEDITKLGKYLEEKNKHYLLACCILHYCLVRRKEMSKLKLSFFNIKNQTLLIPADASKNRDARTVTLPEKVIHLMLDLKIFDNPSHYYLFTDDFKPGPKRKYEKQFTDFWAYHVRKDLKFPANYQFYSLKDTGITNMLGKYDVLTVRDQARHSSIEMTNKYTPWNNERANPELKKHDGNL